MGQHIATYPLYGTHPISLVVQTNKRIGTGYIYTHEQIDRERRRLDRYGHPLNLRWRNDECRTAYFDWLRSEAAP